MQQILTDDGLCWAIILNPTQSLENVITLKNHLVGVLITANQSHLYDTSREEFCSVLALLSEMQPSFAQIEQFERFLTSQRK